MGKGDLRAQIEELRSAVEQFQKAKNNEVGVYGVARHELLNALSAAVLAIGDKLSDEDG